MDKLLGIPLAPGDVQISSSSINKPTSIVTFLNPKEVKLTRLDILFRKLSKIKDLHQQLF